MSFSPQYSLYSPLLSIFLLMLAHGPFNTFVALEMEGNSVPIEVQGLIHSIYFFGLLLGPFCIERFMHKVGAIRSFIACCSAYAAAVALQALVPGLWVLVPMRFLAGLSISAIYLIIESWLMLAGGSAMRGRRSALRPCCRRRPPSWPNCNPAMKFTSAIIRAGIDGW